MLDETTVVGREQNIQTFFSIEVLLEDSPIWITNIQIVHQRDHQLVVDK